MKLRSSRCFAHPLKVWFSGVLIGACTLLRDDGLDVLVVLILLHAECTRGTRAQLWQLPHSAHTHGLVEHPYAYERRVLRLFDRGALVVTTDDLTRRVRAAHADAWQAEGRARERYGGGAARGPACFPNGKAGRPLPVLQSLTPQPVGRGQSDRRAGFRASSRAAAWAATHGYWRPSGGRPSVHATARPKLCAVARVLRARLPAGLVGDRPSWLPQQYVAMIVPVPAWPGSTA